MRPSFQGNIGNATSDPMLRSCLCCRRNAPTSELNMASSQTYHWQFAKEVVHFSSQYGNDGSTAYVAPNLAGPITVFPNYGDVTGACVFRTYGPWWEESPSAPEPFKRRSIKPYLGQDFIDISFNKAVYPTSIKVYQNYHPGAIVQIFAREIDTSNKINLRTDYVKWHLVWSGPPETMNTAKAVVLSADFPKLTFKTDFVRLILHHSHLGYYTELDSIELYGTLNRQPSEGTDLDEAYIQHFTNLSLQNDTKQAIPITTEELPDTGNGHFDKLPGELVQVIFTYLEIPDLCNAAIVCKLFHQFCYDALQYMEMDFQPYWHMVTNSTLDGLLNRCSQLQRLSLSWCGDWGMISPKTFNRFILKCGSHLQWLRLSASRFTTTENIRSIANTCTQLEELDLSSCRSIPSEAFESIAQLKKLTRLNLYRTTIAEPAMHSIIRSCKQLEHLNLGNVKTIPNYDDTVRELAIHCKYLKSLNVWRAKTLSQVGLGHLSAGCHDLEELDMGWCSDLNATSNCFVNLVQSCRKLRKLVLTAIRSVCDNDLYAIASYSTEMEQVDILGTMQVGPQSVDRVLQNCTKLRFFDLSFCNNIPNDSILNWRETYPSVSIKRSFTQASF